MLLSMWFRAANQIVTKNTSSLRGKFERIISSMLNYILKFTAGLKIYILRYVHYRFLTLKMNWYISFEYIVHGEGMPLFSIGRKCIQEWREVQDSKVYEWYHVTSDEHILVFLSWIIWCLQIISIPNSCE